jgi:hypothetical protein
MTAPCPLGREAAAGFANADSLMRAPAKVAATIARRDGSTKGWLVSVIGISLILEKILPDFPI